MTISGRGNLDSVTAPDLEETEDFKVYEPQVTIKGGKKIYEQVIIPKTDMATLVPGISFSFFDPKTGKYKTIERKDISVKALAQPEEEAVKVVSMKGMEKVFYPPEKLGEDIVHIKELSGRFTQRGRFLYQNWVFWAGQAIPIGVFLGFYAMYREKQKMRTDKGYARFTRAPKKARIGMAESKSHLGKNRIPEFYDAVFRTLQEYLADKFNLPIGSVTVNIIDEKFRPAGLDEDMLEMLKDVFSKCDMARYAAGLTGKKEAKEILDKTRRIIDYLERARL
jgi:hypothetical protein